MCGTLFDLRFTDASVGSWDREENGRKIGDSGSGMKRGLNYFSKGKIGKSEIIDYLWSC